MSAQSESGPNHKAFHSLFGLSNAETPDFQSEILRIVSRVIVIVR